MRRAWPVLVLAMALLAAACGDDDAPAADAAVGDGGDAGVAPLTVPPPEATLLPVLTPCATGWRASSEGELTVCEPWPEGGAVDCGVGEAHFPGGTGCVRLGGACPTGRFADGLPPGTVYVDADVALGAGSGTLADPLGSIAAALALAPAGGTVALSRGTFDEGASVSSGSVTIVGACVADTMWSFSGPDPFAAPLTVAGGNVTVRNVRLTASHAGLVVSGAAAVGVAEGVQIDDFALNAAYVGEGGRLTLRDSALRDARAATDDTFTGRGINVLARATLDLERVVFERVSDIGVIATRDGTTLTVRDVAVRQTRPRAHDLRAGRAFEIASGADADLERVVIEDCADVAVLVGALGTTVRIADGVIRRTESHAGTHLNGRGIEVSNGAALTLERVRLDDNRQTGLNVQDDGSSVSGHDVVVRRTRERESDLTAGRGLEVETLCSATLERAYLEGNRDLGILVTEQATADFTDLTIVRTESNRSTARQGTGIAIQFGSTVSIVRGRIAENRESGLLVLGEGTSLVASDLDVLDSRSWESTGVAGRGLGVQQGGRAEVTRSRFARNRDTGVFAYQPGSTVVLRDVTVLETAFPECAASTPCIAPSIGLAAVLGGHIDAARFVVADGLLIGVQVALDGTMDLADGEVRGHPVGASVQTVGFDVSRISTRVSYRDNDRILDTSELPVPEPGTIL